MLNSKLDRNALRVMLALLAGAFAVAVVTFPTRSVARDGGAIIGAIAGVAAAAIIANGIAQQHQPRAYRSARHRRHVERRSRPTASQASMSDPFAGVAATKVRSAKD